MSDNDGEAFARWLMRLFPLSSDAAGGAPLAPFPKRREGFVAAGSVASVAQAACTANTGGAGIVAARMLSLDHLWTEIRVRGGAYGGGFVRKANGEASFLSWNDPNPARSLGVYAASGDALRKAAEGDFENYIIGAVALTEPYLTPSGEMEWASARVLSGRTIADAQRTRREMLKTARADLLAFADAVDAMARDPSVCVIGGREQVDACAGLLDSVETVLRE